MGAMLGRRTSKIAIIETLKDPFKGIHKKENRDKKLSHKEEINVQRMASQSYHEIHP